MTRIIETRCTHCETFYTWQASGHGCHNQFASEEYCDICNKAIQDTLAEIPRKYECRYENIQNLPNFSNITLDVVFEWEKKEKELKEPKGMLRGTRIWPGLYNVDTGDSQSIREVIGRDNYRWLSVRLSTWTVDPEHKIELPMEYDLTKGKFTGNVWNEI